jgi:hypothetical protein
VGVCAGRNAQVAFRDVAICVSIVAIRSLFVVALLVVPTAHAAGSLLALLPGSSLLVLNALCLAVGNRDSEASVLAAYMHTLAAHALLLAALRGGIALETQV